MILFVLLAVLCLIAYWQFRRNLKIRYVQFSIQGKSGRMYEGVVGDDISNQMFLSPYNGAGVVLPARLPEIYLDAQRQRSIIGPKHFMPQDQQLSLEGDFGHYFTVYAPKGYQVLALSILTPEVLQCLKQAAHRYDVWIDGSTVHLITRARVYKRSEVTAEAEAIITQIVHQIDDRLRSWTADDEEEARQARLVMEDFGGLQFFGYNFRTTSIVLGTVYLLAGAMVWLVTYLTLHDSHTHTSTTETVVILGVSFLFFPCLFLYIIIGFPRGWLNWFGRLLDWYSRL